MSISIQRKIGVTTWIFGHNKLEKTANIISEMGFDGVELYVDINQTQPQNVKNILADNGLEIFSMTPSNVDLGSSDRQTRTVALDYYKKLIDYGAELGNPIITCHEYIQSQMGTTYAGSRDNLIASCQELAVYAEKAKIKLGFEPLNRYLCRFIMNSNDVLSLLAEIKEPNMTVILDTYHGNLEEANLVEAIQRCGDKLSVYQIADSNRKGIGFGHTNFAEHFDALDEIKFSGPIILECAKPRQTPGSKEEIDLDELTFHLSVSKKWIVNQTKVLVANS
ncbi:MAG: sugar phosphate isomerase/epimerase [Okeania sp. SIO1H6]|uniref:Sugar phosphate isomerase/epimerase n=1 Tax=Okeania hirsuta TaxID=1458930 RepID=A0A3N6RSA4_9CYAN|nr:MULTISPECIES: sugar phosphate isomerase/epimerase family protein [Okeania]NET13601.1 sugar phosphate isomerase/epimerase [Okeania sp. SIO1H6]NES89070.1 sugar phosphate isomerase/epimerase [Okeania sp. SIO2B9]RQH24288.1 sugar phosphate isomerase/epimerase [Okeania hirsuta]RQH45437.1 sugar phosphate isomerase/epimerase [Okeania hirsuta]RQH45440.1 sugar phosphate isomerase/epimerase [Okeania hirsuta]